LPLLASLKSAYGTPGGWDLVPLKYIGYFFNIYKIGLSNCRKPSRSGFEFMESAIEILTFSQPAYNVVDITLIGALW